MEKINVAELLKDCPKGMELDCTCADNVVFDKIIEYEQIKCVIGDCHDPLILDKYGRLLYVCFHKCVIFPKGKTTWEGFVPPCQFKDGDIVATDSGRWLGIIKNKYNSEYYTVHCAIDYTFNDIFYRCGEYRFSRLATEEEKEKLFQAIKENGYKWDAETKTLEKLIEPEFKVGDRIKEKQSGVIGEVIDVQRNKYNVKVDNNKGLYVWFHEQDAWEFAPSKFDISSLIPFESKVLVRNDEHQYWIPAFWGCKRADGYTTTFGWCKYCIPFEGNKHLLGTTDDCDEYFKTWESYEMD